MAMTLAEFNALSALLEDNRSIVSVYSGRPGCMCGCNGNYRYNSEHVDLGAKRRGYPVDKEDVNDGQVTRIRRFFVEALASGEVDIQLVHAKDSVIAVCDYEGRTRAIYFV